MSGSIQPENGKCTGNPGLSISVWSLSSRPEWYLGRAYSHVASAFQRYIISPTPWYLPELDGYLLKYTLHYRGAKVESNPCDSALQPILFIPFINNRRQLSDHRVRITRRQFMRTLRSNSRILPLEHRCRGCCVSQLRRPLLFLQLGHALKGRR